MRDGLAVSTTRNGVTIAFGMGPLTYQAITGALARHIFADSQGVVPKVLCTGLNHRSISADSLNSTTRSDPSATSQTTAKRDPSGRKWISSRTRRAPSTRSRRTSDMARLLTASLVCWMQMRRGRSVGLERTALLAGMNFEGPRAEEIVGWCAPSNGRVEDGGWPRASEQRARVRAKMALLHSGTCRH